MERVRRQQQAGYQLVTLTDPATVLALAGFRLSECFAWGKFLYVDDLVTHPQSRSQGYGEQVLNWLTDYAQQHHCQTLELDSGVQRFAAH